MSILPYPLEYSSPFSFDKNGTYKVSSTRIFSKGNLSALGTLPKELETARQQATGVGNTLENQLKLVRNYIAMAEAFKQQLQVNVPSYEMKWTWSSYLYEKSEQITNIDIEKAMLLIRLVFKFIDRCRVANHLEPILSGDSLGQKRLDSKIISETIKNYKTAKDILYYILELNIKESKFPELNKTYLKGLLYYIQGLQMIFVGFLMSYSDNISQISLAEYITEEVKFDDGILGEYYATAAEFLTKANSEFMSNQIPINTKVKEMSDILKERCDLLIPFFKSMSYLLYGIPTLDLFEYNSIEKENNIRKIKNTLELTREKLVKRLMYITKVKSIFMPTLYSTLYNNHDINSIMEYYHAVIDKVENGFKDMTVTAEPEPIYREDELKKQPTPIIIANSVINGCKFCGFELNIPANMIQLPVAYGKNDIYNDSISLLFPDIYQMK